MSLSAMSPYGFEYLDLMTAQKKPEMAASHLACELHVSAIYILQMSSEML